MTDIDTRVERYAPLADISIRSEGDGRTVDALAAVFNAPQEVRDIEGHYHEVLAPSAFDKTLAQRSHRLQYMFNHGKTMYGTPSERFSMPIGKPIEVKADAAGLFTRSEVAKTELGDEVLELIKTGAIQGYSFSGAFRSTLREPSRERGGLPTYTRTEVAMREYGPTPFPVYEDARIVGVRSESKELMETLTGDELVAFLEALPEAARANMFAVLKEMAHTETGDGHSDHTDTGLSADVKARARKALLTYDLRKRKVA